MVVQSHNIMSNLIFDYIAENTNVNLNKFRFKIGNMSPDLPLYHSHLKHYKNQNYGYILDMIAELMETDPTDDSLVKGYPYRLGLVCHYVCDYFCLPHHNRNYFHDKLGEHLNYEMDLHQNIKNFTREDYLPQFALKEIVENKEGSPLDFVELIEVFHHQYMDETPSFDIDASYAITVASILASIIVMASVHAIDAEAISYEVFTNKFAEVFA